MDLTVLTDNNTYIDQYYLAEPALCYYLEDDGTRILLDTGYSDVYRKNADSLGVDLTQVDVIAISHAHNDHTGGLPFFPVRDGSVRLVAHPELFTPRLEDGLQIGVPLSQEELQTQFTLALTRTPVALSPHITYLGEIPRLFPFENQKPVGQRLTDAGWVPDFLPDDTGLVYEVPDGIYVIAGCSHSGICNTIEYAKKVTGKSRVKGMIGGCHLFSSDELQIQKTAEYLAAQNIPALYPCHCTSFAARAAIHARTPVQEVGVGLKLHW